MPTAIPRATLALSDVARAALDARTEPISGGMNRSEAADRIITRYDDMMVIGRQELTGLFTLPELAFLLDVLATSAVHDRSSIRNMHITTQDALPDYGPLHGVEGDGVVAKLSMLSFLERYALIDAMERFRAGTARGEGPELRAVFA